MAEKAQCTGCVGKFTVTVKGIIRLHQRQVWDGHAAKYILTDPCPGASKPPRGAAVAVRQVAKEYSTVANRKPQVKGGAGALGWQVAQEAAYKKAGLKWPPKMEKMR